MSYLTYQGEVIQQNHKYLINVVSAPSEIVIGTQTWKTRNVADVIANSVVYEDNEANRAIYGGLYNQPMLASIVSLYPGWHVPSVAEWAILYNYLGGETLASSPMKEAGLAHWTTPPNDGTNSSGFTALPAGNGAENYPSISYNSINSFARFWSSNSGQGLTLIENMPDVFPSTSLSPDQNYFSVRLIKNP